MYFGIISNTIDKKLELLFNIRDIKVFFRGIPK